VTSILLVEDSRDDEELVMLALQQAGIQASVTVAHDGEEAMERVSPAFQLVLLDLKLPKLDGFEVLRRIREGQATRHLPVVVFSSSDLPVDVERAYRLGANAFVSKPVEFEEYADVVKKIGAFWIALNRKP
jgi:two-component system, response regulator